MPNIVDIIFSEHNKVNSDEKLEFSICLNRVNGGYMSVGGKYFNNLIILKFFCVYWVFLLFFLIFDCF